MKILPPSTEILPVPLLARIYERWQGSLRFRLLALGLMPLLLAFPVVVVVLIWVGGDRADSLLLANLRGNLVGAGNYLDHVKAEAGLRVSQLVKSERLVRLAGERVNGREMRELLSTAAKGSGLDYLMVATLDGVVLSASNGVAPGTRLPDGYVMRQAVAGVANAAFERVPLAQLAAYAPELGAALASGQDGMAAAEGAGQPVLLISAAAHFPLSVNNLDAILVGGMMLNRNTALIEHMREILFPVGTLPGDAEGLTAIYLGERPIVMSRQRFQGNRALDTRLDSGIPHAVLGQRESWFGRLDFAGVSHRIAFDPILDGEGGVVGMISVGIPDGYYRSQTYLLLGAIASVMALTMLGLSLLFLRAGNQLTRRLGGISEAMNRVAAGDRQARVARDALGDEVSLLGQHFNELLTTISVQDELRRAALQATADESSRRRALFEHVRDGVVILNQDGSVFEANPKAAAMLGYSLEELRKLSAIDWDVNLHAAELAAIVHGVGNDGRVQESRHRRKDGSTYMAEVSISCAVWAGRAYILLLQRDITDRKAVESELDNYRSSLEMLVDQRTKELNERSEQLDAIFTLSPDGFVSFDREHRVNFVNQSFLRMSGLRREEVIGLDETAFSQHLAVRSLPTALFPGVAALRAARARLDETDGGEASDKRRKTFELQGPGNRVLEVGIRLSESPAVSQILYFRDVSVETEVERMKSEFLSTAAHELRTPMSSIYGFAQLLMLRQFDPEKQKEMMGTIVRQAELMISIINELLDLARIEARRGKDFVIERVNLFDLVQEVVGGYNIPLERAAPEIVPADAPLWIDADRRKMLQALLNVLSNAYKYSPHGGLVRIEMIGDAAATPPRAGIRIIDQGLGMTPEQVARVFERFYRADSSGNIPGTGLGMCVVKEIVELHGGEVTVESRHGEGTTVTVWVPLAGRQPPVNPTPDAGEREAAESAYLDSW